MSKWFTEQQANHFGIWLKVKQTLCDEATNFHQIEIFDTDEFGRMLVLDGMVMTTEKDEFVYHEMIAHIPLFTHPDPKNVLVVGGGDGGVIREIIKHPGVETITMVEVDEKVIEYSQRYLPVIASGFKHPKVRVEIEDGQEYVSKHRDHFDVIIIDSTEPVGPGMNLFKREFYNAIFKALKQDGLFVTQSDNPWFKSDLIKVIHREVGGIFPITRLYMANIPTYPGGMWTFTIGSKQYNPLQVENSRFHEIDTKYYTRAMHQAAFTLPKFVADIIE